MLMVESVPSDVYNGCEWDFHVLVCGWNSRKSAELTEINHWKIENGAFRSLNLQPVQFLVVGELEDELIDYSVDPQCAAYKL
jgi:hypothetical protein